MEKNEWLSDEELIEFIVQPLSYQKREEKEQRLKKTVELEVRIKDRKQQMFTLAGLLFFSDKVMAPETAKRVRKVIEMTQAARIFEEERLEAIRQVTESVTERITK